MTQPPPRSPLPPRPPMAPLPPGRPLQPLQRLVPMRPLTPLRPGERRVPVSDRRAVPAPAPHPPGLGQPPPAPQQPVVNPGLSQPAAGLAVPGPRRPVAVRRPSGNKAGAVIGVVVASVVGLAAIGSRSSNGSRPVAVPSVSIPPLSIGGTVGGAAQRDAPHPGASRATPHSGRTLSLTGTVSGERIKVTFLRWADDASTTDAFFGPGSGKRYVAAQFRITNTGSVGYVDSPANGARVIDRSGRAYGTTFLVSKLREGKVFDAAVSLETGRSAVGWLVFEVPKRAKIRQVQFSENSGFGQRGTWTFAA